MPTTIITDRELGRGVDGFHPETKLGEGFVVQATNWLPTYAGTLKRRTGYARIGGGLPVRVESASRSGTTITLQLSSSFNTAGLTPGPVAVWARLIQYGSNFSDFGGITAQPQLLYFSTYTIVSATQIAVSGAPITNTGYTQTVVPGTTTPASGYTKTGLDCFVWGLPLDWLVTNPDAQRTTWVTGLFSYQYTGDDTPVAIVGRRHHVLGPTSGVVYPASTALVSATAAGAQVIGRAIYGSIPVTPPTRGYVVSPGVGSSGTLAVSSAVYDSVSTHTIYTLAAPGLVTSGPIAGIIEPGADTLTVTECAYAELNGEFNIAAVTTGVNSVVVTCINAPNAIPGSQHSDTGGAGRGGVFTDAIIVDGLNRIFPGDVVTPASLSAQPPNWTCANSGAGFVAISGLQEPATYSLPDDDILSGLRTAASVPIPFADEAQAFVRGDCVSVVGYEEQFVVQSITTGADQAITVTGNGFFGSVSGLATTSTIRVGDALTLWSAGLFTGDVVVTTILSGTSVGFDTSVSDTASGFVLGDVLHLDTDIQFSHGAGVSVPARWTPVPTPDVPRDNLISTLNRQYDFPEGGTTDASFLNGAQVGGSLFTTNEFDSVQKFDGTEEWRSGLPNWNPLIGFELHDVAGALIDNPNSTSLGSLNAAGTQFTCATPGEAGGFPSGTTVVISLSSGVTSSIQWPTAVSGAPANDTGIIPLSPSIPPTLGINGSSGLRISYAVQLRYYFRWVARDANGQEAASYAPASQDTLVVFGRPCVVSMKLATMAVSGVRKYDSIELEIYRTGENTAIPSIADGGPPFYRIAVIPLKYAFDGATPTGTPPIANTRYFETYEDANQVSLGSSGSADPLAVLVSGTKVGAYWDEPPRAKTAVAWNGQLILGNIRSRPQIDLAVRESPTQSAGFTAAAAAGTRCIFRREGTTASVTDVANVQAYEIINSALFAYPQVKFVRSRTPNLLNFDVNSPLSVPLFVGGWVYVSAPFDVVTQPIYGGLDTLGWFQVVSIGASDIAGHTTVTVAWPEKSRSHVTDPSTQVNGITHTITVDGGIPTGYALGTPLFITPAVGNMAAGLSVGTPYYAIPVTPTSFKVASNIQNAKTNIAVSADGSGGPFSISTGYTVPVDQSYLLTGANGYDVPVPAPSVPQSSPVFREPGFYSPEWPVRTTSLDLQLVVDSLSRAINAVQAGSWVNPVASSASRDPWLMATSGADYPFATSRVRTGSDSVEWTVEWEGTTDDAGREKFLIYAGDVRVPNFSISAAAVAAGSPWITRVAHALDTNQTVRVSPSTGGSLPAPLAINTPYYVVVHGANQFGLATSPGGSPLVLTTTGSGFTQVRAEVPAAELRFPSRLVKSYPNYPEIFDFPFASTGDVAGGHSDSVIDVSPADGDEIQATRLFYSNSFTLPAQQQARLVVLKSRFVYMVDPDSGAVQQIQTNGHGAEFPRSAGDSRNAIQFANRVGVHRIDRSNQWVFTSQILGRVWDEQFDSTVEADIPVAVSAAKHNQYRLTMLEAGASVPTNVIVYDYTREVGGEPGAWTVFDDYPSTTWTEHLGVNYHGDRNGRVYVDRGVGDNSDYRDDSGAYVSTCLLRAMDFGALGSRKRLSRISIQFRRSGPNSVDDVVVTVAIDGQTVQLKADPVDLSANPPATGTGDVQPPNVYSISFSPTVRKADYFQVGISVAGIDEPLEICQISYHVELLTEHGVTQAAGTTGTT